MTWPCDRWDRGRGDYFSTVINYLALLACKVTVLSIATASTRHCEKY